MKDASGSYAVFTEQGSSASQMTAAKIMDFISRQTGCAGQAADAVSAHTQVKMEDAQMFGSVYHDTNGLNHGPVWKIRLFLFSAICAVILWQDYYGNGNLRKFSWNMVGKKYRIGKVYSLTGKKTLLISVCGRYKNWLEMKQKTWNRLGKCL